MRRGTSESGSQEKDQNKRQRFEDGFENISISNDVYQGSSVYMSNSYPIHKLPFVEPSKMQKRHAFYRFTTLSPPPTSTQSQQMS
jgi:hypothetical protein